MSKGIKASECVSNTLLGCVSVPRSFWFLFSFFSISSLMLSSHFDYFSCLSLDRSVLLSCPCSSPFVYMFLFSMNKLGKKNTVGVSHRTNHNILENPYSRYMFLKENRNCFKSVICLLIKQFI
jgi:hypothetical protein